ncbi:sigma-70 family RNA polymerase sigma factor [Companilactobacillus futsaii]|uniref:Sigma-70 family RNA polymerase sigma factor n=2 Tax=Companilactobacillus futsaii TaxID=938155 RepID=A0A5B7SV79_9LACO|nr:sigma-70 family RNA polymerase sigma factor [Companilactobacillus futsaii]KRK93657.1 RNA polymerase sigma factor [Companilactobacillus futsaii JCM 17355]QCX23916.1 sigma-70 family RNA polymerase sigma factor [Companilactobacillus futsaii]
MNEMELGFKDALQNQRLIHGALKRAHIYTTRVDYEDYFQEAMINYAQTYQQYVQDNGDMTKFHKFVFQKLTWRLIDMLRQEKRYFDFHSLEEFDFQRVPEDLSENKLDFVNFSELTNLDRTLLQEHFIEDIPLVILAKRYNHTTRALRYRRDSLLKKLRHMSKH